MRALHTDTEQIEVHGLIPKFEPDFEGVFRQEAKDNRSRLIRPQGLALFIGLVPLVILIEPHFFDSAAGYGGLAIAAVAAVMRILLRPTSFSVLAADSLFNFGLALALWQTVSPDRFQVLVSYAVGFVLLAYVFPPLLLLERIVLGLLIAAIHWIFYGANTALAATLSILPAFVAAHLFGFFVARSLEVSERKQFLIGGKLMAQKELSESLLLNVLPGPIAQRLRAQTTIIADHHPEVTILFADLVGFTAMAGRISPDSLVQILNSLFSEFDDHCDRLGIEKIKTIGDSYMAVCGLPEPEPRHAEKIAELAIAMQRTVANAKLPAKETLALRIGINTGPVVAGVIGKRKFLYDLWGETVNLASRLEAAGQPGRIHVAKTTYKHLREKFSFEPASSHDIKGVGTIETYLMALDT